MGRSIVPDGHVGHLLLLYLEGGQDDWKGTWKHFKMKVCTFWTLSGLHGSRWCISPLPYPM